MVSLEILSCLKMATVGQKRWLKMNNILHYVVCSRYSSQVITTNKIATMGSAQILRLVLKRLLTDQGYGLWINHIELYQVKYGIGMPFFEWPSFSNTAIIFPVHNIDSISAFQHSIRENGRLVWEEVSETINKTKRIILWIWHRHSHEFYCRAKIQCKTSI